MVSPVLIAAIGSALAIYLLLGSRQIKEWEIALKFTFGRFVSRKGPGLRVFLPIFQRMRRIDMRTRTRDLFRQAVISHDNVTLSVDAVVYFRVVDAEKAILAVEDFEAAMKDRAKVVLRDVIGETQLDQVLAHREAIAAKVQEQIETVVSKWGLHVELIGLQDIQLPPQMQEVLAKAAIAERERSYVIIKSQADIESAKNFAEAARTLASSPGAIELRRFEALQTLTQEGTSKVIFDLTKTFDEVHRSAVAISAAMADHHPEHLEPPAPHPDERSPSKPPAQSGH
ncbi:MAG: SPFH domain-containing protein [Deltaproteobacteria bacterium]|nr:SPFH domain-containing protein [Deltaproteobacteria bacterium]